MSQSIAKILLKKGKEASPLRFHPWIFSGAIARIEGGSPEDGDIVQVFSAEGQCLGTGHYHQGSITVRLLSFQDQALDLAFWTSRLQEALTLRRKLGLCDDPKTNIYRLLHGEGDNCSGLIIDIYGDVAVFQAHSIGMHRQRELIAEALRQVYGLEIKAMYDKSQGTLPNQYARQAKFGYLFDYRVKHQGHALVREHGLQFSVDWEEGQKTGFFIDQRDNRQLVAEYSRGRRVLNAFCYSGGFSLQALAGGAARVDSVDVSAKAIALTEANVLANSFEGERHQAHVADVMDFLRQAEGDWDLMILDPPAYAKRLDKRHQAIQGYKRLNAEGMKRLAPGSLLFTFSCSQVVDTELFQGAVLAGALEAGRKVKILRRLGQSADHPVSIYHPEGSYLKGLMLYVE